MRLTRARHAREPGDLLGDQPLRVEQQDIVVLAHQRVLAHVGVAHAYDGLLCAEAAAGERGENVDRVVVLAAS